MKKLLVILVILISVAVIFELLSQNFPSLPSIFNDARQNTSNEPKLLLSEETAVVRVVEKVGPSVVTIGVINQSLQRNGSVNLFFPEEAVDESPKERYIG